MKHTKIPKAYNPQKVEKKIYKTWEESGFFNSDKLPGKRTKKYSIVLPPPNATGVLHMGHSLMLAIQDAEIRFHRMRGYKTLWLPGEDHASIATQNVVEKLLLKEGKTKEDLGRKAFLREVEKFVKKSRNTIRSQIKRMGSSCDWSRERYTLDEGIAFAVKKIFVDMYKDGLIYRGWRMVNWCPRCSSTLADDEVEHKEILGNLYYFKYPLLNGGYLPVATTRPETILGDTALVVNPKDKRYKSFIGEIAVVPIVNREIPILADEYVSMDFGTGVLKVTPGHDPNDFNIGKKYKLDVIDIFDNYGKIDPKSAQYHNFEEYAGLDRFQAREKMVDDLKKQELLIKIESHKHSVGHCYRCGTIIEPKVSQQWFVNVSKKTKNGKSLKQMAREVVKRGLITIEPERFKKVYFHWINNLDDWCISRQIWFGHRLPVYYCQDCQEVMVALDKPKQCTKCKSKKIKQDEDTLDTWFSSGTWTFSTLGWPKKTKDLKNFHPTSLMETGYDILFFWVARMIMMTMYALGEIPFKRVYLHGLVRDDQGRKMSKSLGNVIDPLMMAERYGADATRLSLVIGNSPGNDLKLSEQKIASFRNFSNKLYNIARYTNLFSKENPRKKNYRKTIADKWILMRLDLLTKEITKHYENIELSFAGEKLRNFIWNDLADWYIEISKKQDYDFLKTILKRILILAHPLMPYITEYLWEFSGYKKGKKGLLIVEKWPEVKAVNKKTQEKIEKEFSVFLDAVKMIRVIRAEYKVDPKKELAVVIISKYKKELERLKDALVFLTKSSEISFFREGQFKKDNSKTYIEALGRGVKVVIKSDDLIDREKEVARIQKELNELLEYANKVSDKLKNPNFLNKAPKHIVDAEKQKYSDLEKRILELEDKLKSL